MRILGLTLVLSALALSACSSTDDGDGGLSEIKSGVFSLFDPVAASKVVPFPNDLLFNGSTDGTVNILPTPPATNPPFVVDANRQDGFSTVASLFTDLIGRVDIASAAAPGAVIVVNARSGTLLIPGVDYRVQLSTVTDPATGLPLNALRSRLLIEPLKPLAPASTHLVVITKALKSTDGVPAEPADLFKVVTSTTAVEDQTLPILSTLGATQKDDLEKIRKVYVASILPKLNAPIASGGLNIPTANIVIAWPVTTQSVRNSLDYLAANVQPQALALSPLPPLPPAIFTPPFSNADIYVGSLVLPYYLADATAGADDAEYGPGDNPLSTFWRADPLKPAAGIAPSGNSCAVQTPVSGSLVCLCANVDPSESTTGCYPVPKPRAAQTVPVVATIPNGIPQPAAGWPVVVFQHGITGNRTQVLALASAMAKAGFASIAIDLPLHGVPSPHPFRVPGTTERTFDLNLVNNGTRAPPADDVIDASGTHFINLSSLITSRDNLRQAAADLMTLTASIGGATGVAFDGSKIRYVGHSLGGIVTGTFLGVNQSNSASVLAMPGGGIAKLLDGSTSFGPSIAAGLQASSGGSIVQGNDNYETFLRFAQTLVDSGDPINYAVAAATNHPILMLEVKGDAVVPNCTVANDANCTAIDTIPISAYLSGTDPLARVMGLNFRPGPTQFDGLDVAPGAGAAPQTITGSDARNNVVRFNQGDHGSILSPAASLDVTCEMQAQVATFLATSLAPAPGGPVLKIGNPCPAP